MEEARRGGQKGLPSQTRVGNGHSSGALTASVEEARRLTRGQKGALWQAPSLPPWKEPDAGGKRALFGALAAPVEEARHGGQKGALWQAPSLPPWKQLDVGGKRARDANLPSLPPWKRPDAGGALWQAPSLPPWKEPDAGGKRALFGCPHCPRGRGQTRGAKRRSLAGALTAPVEAARRGWETGSRCEPSLPLCLTLSCCRCPRG